MEERYVRGWTLTSSVDARMDLDLRVAGHHAGPPGVSAHLGPHQIANLILLAAARASDDGGKVPLNLLTGG